jgi:hypothetical protein
LFNSGTLIIENTTLTDNAVGVGGLGLNDIPALSGIGGGVLNIGSGTVTLENSIVSDNGPSNLEASAFALRLRANNFTSGDPVLAPLGFYGGLTPTRPPLPGSPVIDAGIASAITPETDQRGFPRIGGAALDIGSCEKHTQLEGITSLVKTPQGTRVNLRWFQPGPMGIQYSPDLSQGSWIDLGNFYFSRAEGSLSFFDPDPVRRERPSGFYRAFQRSSP